MVRPITSIGVAAQAGEARRRGFIGLPSEKQWDVFLSYSSRDATIASMIACDLKNAGMRIWFDQDIIIGGQRLRHHIDAGLKNSRKVVILISSASLKSKWVLNELDAAMLREINEGSTIVIPILIGKFDTQKLPGDLTGKRYIDLRYNFSRKYDVARSSIIEAICSTEEQ